LIGAVIVIIPLLITDFENARRDIVHFSSHQTKVVAVSSVPIVIERAAYSMQQRRAGGH
jgi:hypothetical protein